MLCKSLGPARGPFAILFHIHPPAENLFHTVFSLLPHLICVFTTVYIMGKEVMVLQERFASYYWIVYPALFGGYVQGDAHIPTLEVTNETTQ